MTSPSTSPSPDNLPLPLSWNLDPFPDIILYLMGITPDHHLFITRLSPTSYALRLTDETYNPPRELTFLLEQDDLDYVHSQISPYVS